MLESLLRPDAPALRRDLQEVAHIGDASSWRENVRRVGLLAPMLNGLTEAVSAHWGFLPEELQRDILETSKSLEAYLESGGSRRFHPSVFDRIWAAFSTDVREDIFEFALAVARFQVELQRALALELANQTAMAERIASDPELSSELNQGYDDFQAGIGTVYTVEELRNRLSIG